MVVRLLPPVCESRALGDLFNKCIRVVYNDRSLLLMYTQIHMHIYSLKIISGVHLIIMLPFSVVLIAQCLRVKYWLSSN